MKYKLLLITFSLLLVISLTVKAEDIINNNNSNKCKTMQNGICTEYFTNTNYEANIQITPKQDMRLINKKETKTVCNNEYGFDYVYDSYNSNWEPFVGIVNNKPKIYLTHITSNSSAARAGLKIGDEITKINNMKVDKIAYNDFSNLLNNSQQINMETKKSDGTKKYVSIVKSNLCTTLEYEPFFNSYWGQIYPYDIDSQLAFLAKISNVSNKLTKQFKYEYNSRQNEINKMLAKRNQFRIGFNLCLANYYNMNDVNNCLNQLVNRSLNQIANEQNLQMQQSAIQTQQQLQQRQINALNNYSYALQNQRMQVDTNVYHSGTINNNINLNGNINGTYYHYRY